MGALHKGYDLCEVGHLSGLLAGPAGGADGVVELGPLLGFILGLEEATDGAEAAGEVGRLNAAVVGQVVSAGRAPVRAPHGFLR